MHIHDQLATLHPLVFFNFIFFGCLTGNVFISSSVSSDITKCHNGHSSMQVQSYIAIYFNAHLGAFLLYAFFYKLASYLVLAVSTSSSLLSGSKSLLAISSTTLL